jgi:tetratricopeptide (TPR) repeat protein
MNQNEALEYINSGDQNLNKGNYEQAAEDFTQAIKLNPNDAGLHYKCGVAHHAIGVTRKDTSSIDRAIEDFNQALKLNPDFAPAYTGRGGAYFSKHEYDRAIEDFNHAMQLDSNDGFAYSGRGGVYVLKGEYDRGIKDFETALRINPDDFDVRKQIETARMLQKVKK